MKNIGILGASGSIGTQTIDILRAEKKKFRLLCFSVGNNIDYANELIEEFDDIKVVCVKNSEDINKVNKRGKEIEIVSGESGLVKVATLEAIDVLVTAVVGFVGMVPTIEAIKKGKDIALANKETLVTAGHIIMPLIKQCGVNIYPVDSEHSAIFQAMQGVEKAEVDKLIITASGGSFRDKSRSDLKTVTVEEALAHPNWIMGSKITIDSATMFNKGLEIIEAHHLFDIAYDDIQPVIHPQSIVHSMIELADGAVIAQLGSPDMRQPIKYALNYPKHESFKGQNRLNFDNIANLTFSKVDFERYPAVKLCIQAGKVGHSMPTCMNAANEVAVDLFLKEKITFLDIEKIVKEEMDQHRIIENPTIEQIIEVDKKIRINILRSYHD